MFGRLFGSRRLPAARRPPLAADERVVAWAEAAAGAVVVATNQGLFLPGRDERLGWHEIHKAGWTGRDLAVTPGQVVASREGYDVTVDAPSLSVSLPEPGRLPQVVRARVTRSVSVTAHHRVPGGGVRVVGRRVPGADGLWWAVRYDQDTDADAPEVVAATDQLVAAQVAQATPEGI